MHPSALRSTASEQITRRWTQAEAETQVDRLGIGCTGTVRIGAADRNAHQVVEAEVIAAIAVQERYVVEADSAPHTRREHHAGRHIGVGKLIEMF